MLTLHRWLFAVLLCLLPWVVQAEVDVPPLQHRVTDLTGTLNAGQRDALERKLAAFETKKGSQIAILIVPTTLPEDIAQYSIRVVEQWKLGRKGVDDGVLVLLAKDDHRSRIEVGYGLEGVLPDAIAKRIAQDVMRPYFRQGDFYGGLAAGVDEIIAVAEGEALPEPGDQQSREGVLQYLPVLFIVAVLAGQTLRTMLGNFLGGVVGGGLVGALIGLLGLGTEVALLFGLIAFIVAMVSGRGNIDGSGSGGFDSGFSGGSAGGGFSGGDSGFSGGGGGFGGGGASGDW